jgi:hypothetical protein
MNFMDQLDPELRVVLEAFPTEGAVNLNNIPAARAKMRKLITAMQATLPAVEGVARKATRLCGSASISQTIGRASYPLSCGFMVVGTSWGTLSKTTDS